MSLALFSCHNANSTSIGDLFTTKSGRQVKIECYRHASLNIEYDGYSLQIDPVTDITHGVQYDDKEKANYILITHDHFDHFDIKAIDELCDNHTQIILTKSCREKLGSGTVISNGDSLTLACGIKIKAIPAYNTTPEHAQFHPKGYGNGYELIIENLRIYIAGDTEVIPEMKQLKNIDIAFLPCNQPYTMTPDQLVEAAKIIHPRVLYPYHYSNTDMSGIEKRLKDFGIEVRIRNMK